MVLFFESNANVPVTSSESEENFTALFPLNVYPPSIPNIETVYVPETFEPHPAKRSVASARAKTAFDFIGLPPGIDVLITTAKTFLSVFSNPASKRLQFHLPFALRLHTLLSFQGDTDN